MRCFRSKIEWPRWTKICWKLRVPTFFSLWFCQLMFFLLYFFEIDVRYAVFIASVSGMFLSLCFKYLDGFRLAVTLSLVEYGSYYANLILWILLTSLILNGPALRLENKYESYVVAAKCGGETIKSTASRSYQEGLNHVHHAIQKSFSSWNETTKEASKVLHQVGAAMYQLSVHMEKLSNLIYDLKAKCYDDTSSALRYCQEKLRQAKLGCAVALQPYHYVCEILYVPAKICEKVMEVDVCSRMTVFVPVHHASTYLKQQAKAVESALNLNVKTLSVIAIDINYAEVREIYMELTNGAKSVISRTIFVWNVMGIMFALAFLMKPVQNYMMVVKYQSHKLTICLKGKVFSYKLTLLNKLMCHQ